MEAFDDRSFFVVSPMAMSTPSVAKIFSPHRVCHEIREDFILDKSDHLATLLLDFINVELRDDIWPWQFLWPGLRLLISSSSGHSKLQGPRVRLNLLQRGDVLCLDAEPVVADLGIAVEFVGRSISGELAETFG